MEIENMEQTLEFLKQIKYFFENIDEIEKKLKAEVYGKEGEKEDYVHEWELSELNVAEIMKWYKAGKKSLRERRIAKDKLELINTLKPYVNKFITKGICAETDATIKNIETLKNNQENRQYTPRVIQDLKCAKRKKEYTNE